MASRRPAERGASYHHGDLRAALVEAARAIAARSGVDAITLRAVAAEAGVSQAAPYHHFPDKASLVAAAVARAFERFDAAMGEAVAAVGSMADEGREVARIVAYADAYVRFSYAHRGDHRLCFGAHVAALDLGRYPETRAAGVAARERLVALVARFLEAAGSDAAPLAVFRLLWAQCQGLAWLAEERELGAAASLDDVATLAREGVDLILAGITGGAAPGSTVELARRA